MRRTLNQLPLAFLFCIFTQVSATYVAGIFFPSLNNIYYYDAITPNVTLFHQVSPTDQVTAVDFDSYGALTNGTSKLYFAVESSSTTTIYSCNLSPSCSSSLQIIKSHTTSATIGGIALDRENTKKVYWVADSDVWVATPDGNLATTVRTGLNKPHHLTVSAQGFIYVALANKNPSKAGDGISKFGVDNTNFQNLLTGSIFNGGGICVDSNSSTLYIIDLDKTSAVNKKIVSADVNGGNLQTVINQNIPYPANIALHSYNGGTDLYWVDTTQKTLNKYNVVSGRTVFPISYNAVDLALHIAVPSPSVTPSPSSTPSSTPSITPSPSKTPSSSPSAGASPSSTPSLTPSTSPSPSPSTSPSPSPSTSPSASASPSSSIPASIVVSPSTSCGSASCTESFASPPATVLKKYSRNQLLAIIVIPFATSFICSAAFIATCLVLLRKSQRTQRLNHSYNSVPLQKNPTPPVHPL